MMFHSSVSDFCLHHGKFCYSYVSHTNWQNSTSLSVYLQEMVSPLICMQKTHSPPANSRRILCLSSAQWCCQS